MERMVQWLWITILLCSQAVVSAQTALPSESLKELSKSSGCTVYTFNYPSVSASGEPTVLSSALFVWTPLLKFRRDSIESLHIFCHSTITADVQRPTTTVSLSNEQTLLKGLPGRDYGSILTETANYVSRCIIIAPDYEGYGATRTVPHPYLSERLTARQVIDAATYGLALYRKEVLNNKRLPPMKSDWRSFTMGYSQGGAVSLATHRYIEEEGLANKLHFQGSICGDGPYDLLTTLRYYIEDDGTSYSVETAHRKGIITMPVVVPLIVKGMFDSYPEMAQYGMEDYLSQQLIDTGVLDWIDSKKYDTDHISQMWYKQLQEGLDASDRHYTPEQMGELFESPEEDIVWGHLEKMFTPEAYEYISDVSHFDAMPGEASGAYETIHRAFAENSLINGWEPQHRIQFFHAKSDMVVPYGNYLAFRDAHSYGEGDLFRVDDTFSNGDHVDAGIDFLVELLTLKSYAKCFNWICEGPSTVIDNVQRPKDNGQYSSVNGQWSDGWYTLDGRRLTTKPTAKGVYICNGRKVAVQ